MTDSPSMFLGVSLLFPEPREDFDAHMAAFAAKGSTWTRDDCPASNWHYDSDTGVTGFLTLSASLAYLSMPYDKNEPWALELVMEASAIADWFGAKECRISPQPTAPMDPDAALALAPYISNVEVTLPVNETFIADLHDAWTAEASVVRPELLRKHPWFSGFLAMSADDIQAIWDWNYDLCALENAQQAEGAPLEVLGLGGGKNALCHTVYVTTRFIRESEALLVCELSREQLATVTQGPSHGGVLWLVAWKDMQDLLKSDKDADGNVFWQLPAEEQFHVLLARARRCGQRLSDIAKVRGTITTYPFGHLFDFDTIDAAHFAKPPRPFQQPSASL